MSPTHMDVGGLAPRSREGSYGEGGLDGQVKVRELRAESKVDAIELVIQEKGASRDFTTRSGATGKVCDAKAVDDQGDEVSVSLWNEEIDRVAAGSRVRITNGWAREWRGNLQVSAGRFGKLEILSPE